MSAVLEHKPFDLRYFVGTVNDEGRVMLSLTQIMRMRMDIREGAELSLDTFLYNLECAILKAEGH